MAREINGTLYRIRGYSGVPHYVECENLYDLYCYIAEHWIMRGCPISSINRMDADGTTPKVAVLSNKNFKRILAKNDLRWRECDKKMLNAIKGGYVHLLEKYPNHSIHNIRIGCEKYYKSYGYEIIKDGDNIFAVKEYAV